MHTPGPWRAGYHSEQDRQREMIVRAEEVDDQPYIALLPNLHDGHCEDNARLIAAAPELLAACRAALAYLAREATERDLACSLARTIAEATGEVRLPDDDDGPDDTDRFGY